MKARNSLKAAVYAFEVAVVKAAPTVAFANDRSKFGRDPENIQEQYRTEL